MISYEKLAKKPRVFKSITGLSIVGIINDRIDRRLHLAQTA